MSEEELYENTFLCDYIESEISKQKLDLKLDDDLGAWLWDFEDVLVESNNNRGYYYTSFIEEVFYDKKYYRIDLQDKELFTTCCWTYLLFDFENNMIVQYGGGELGESTERCWDQYFNELILRGSSYEFDLNTDSLLKLLLSGISYIHARRIVDLRKQGIVITRENFNDYIELDDFKDRLDPLKLKK